jgi:hypothetical protein
MKEGFWGLGEIGLVFRFIVGLREFLGILENFRKIFTFDS